MGAPFTFWHGSNTCFFFFSFFVHFCIVSMNVSSYEDWGVDELIVEDSWKRQVGGD